jgi:V/A-type H+-transporting ATPase subunit D
MAIQFQYNKTSLQALEKQLKVRVRALPTIKNKESALRLEVKRTKDEQKALEEAFYTQMNSYDHLSKLWNEFDPTLIAIKEVEFDAKKVAGVLVPIFGSLIFDEKPYSLFNAPIWFSDGVALLKQIAETGIRAEIETMKLERLERARRKTTQKVNLFEKVQIPGYGDAILKIKRYLEDEESLSKSSQKIMRANLEKQQRKEAEA